MMNKFKLLLSCLLLLSIHVTNAQESASNDNDAVRETVESLFDGMNAGDSEKVAATFHPEARLHSAFSREERSMVRSTPIAKFVESMDTEEVLWKEEIFDVEITIDGNMAQAWVPYRFYLNGDLLHCGVNSMHLVKENDNWQIIQLTDSRRKENCEGK